MSIAFKSYVRGKWFYALVQKLMLAKKSSLTSACVDLRPKTPASRPQIMKRTKLTYPDNSKVKYQYDSLSRLTYIRDDSNNVLARYAYDGLSRRKLLTLGNDANAVYSYNIGDRLTKLDNKISANHLVFDYTYDNVGNRKTMKVDSSNTHRYTYDGIYRITRADYPSVADANYYYDPVGNRRKVEKNGTTNYTANNLNEYTAVGGASYSYDNNGNLKNDGTYKYYYDCENRLIDVNDQSNNHKASYEYDYLGRRVKKTVYGSPNVVTKYVYDGDQIVAEYNGSGTLVRKYVYGPGIDEPVCMITASGTKYYYHFDGLGSVVALSDAGHNIVERYSYDAFGEPNRVSNVGNPYMFTGRAYDPNTGLYDYRARVYKPQIGRFLQTDPVAQFMQIASVQRLSERDIPGKYLSPMGMQKFLSTDPIGSFLLVHPAGRFLQVYQSGFPAELNLYTYCGNNPLIYLDPYGLGFWSGFGSWLGHTAEGFLDAVTHGIGGGGAAALRGGTSVGAYAGAINGLSNPDPGAALDFAGSAAYGKLAGIAQTGACK